MLASCCNKKDNTYLNHTAIEIRGDLQASFRGNEGPNISGIASLRHNDCPNIEAFSRAGLNYEYLFAGNNSPLNGAVPREGPFPLTEQGNKLVLTRRKEDSPREVAVTVSYEVVPPHYIDFEVKCRFHNLNYFQEGQWAGLFFASYMASTNTSDINFLTADGWRNTSSIPLGRTIASDNPLDLSYDINDPTLGLNMPYDVNLKALKPFYYGLISQGDKKMIYEIMFEFLRKGNEEVRFSIWKWQAFTPAWDFLWIINKPELNKDYVLKGRVVWKPFISQDDTIQEYKNWLKTR